MNDSFFEVPELRLSDRSIKPKQSVFIFGIVNCTPDSFYEKSRFMDNAVEKALSMIEAGADVIDIGGESTRPGSAYISEEEEISRVIPVVRELRKKTGCPISIDTRKPAVMARALDEGADILNDISAMTDGGEEMADLVSDRKIPVILMHKRGNPDIMQLNTAYDDVLAETGDFFRERVRFAVNHGIDCDKIIIDAGIGFGKDLVSNSRLILGSADLLESIPSEMRPVHVMMALSRKSCIGQMTGREVNDRLAGTLAANLIALEHGATMLRVHDVAETRDMLCVYSALKKF